MMMMSCKQTLYNIKKATSSFFINSLAVGADTMIWRALGLMNPSSTALSMKESKELQ